ncbi:MAG: tetratricopeptide repeat protein [Microbacterium sp.]|uniref:tetratricopeptide repeat protein n=1 Tax=Microbacterium sp. TaxID=51671 RepID=UPI0039E498B3
MFVDYYELLRIAPDADPETVAEAIRLQRYAWRRRARHPRARTRAVAEQVCAHIARAEEVLLHVERRRAYDGRVAEDETAAMIVGPHGRDGWELLRAGRVAAASRAAHAATTRSPADPDAWYLRGLTSHALGDTADAESALSEAIRLDPAEPAYHCELGDLYAAAALPAAAQAAYRRAGDLDPRSPYCRVALAAMACARGDADVALPVLERAVRADPADDLARLSYATALAAVTTQLWSRQADGTPRILNEAQLDASRRNLRRIRELRVDDPGLERRVDRLARAVDEAERIGWHTSPDIVLYLAALSAALTGAVVAFALVWSGAATAWLAALSCAAAVIVIPAVFVTSHRVPGWRWARAHAPEPVRRTGLQPDATAERA